MDLRRYIHPLTILLLTFAILVLMHSFSTPIFEAPDEVWHYAYVRWIAKGQGLPEMDSNASGANQEVAQPPLYYAVAALLSAPFSDASLDTITWPNPNFGYQALGNMPDNKNMLVHTDREWWPWRGAVLTMRITRLASLGFGLLTVAAAWALGYTTFKNQRAALLTAALVAAHPQFVFMCGVVSNDSAAAALSTAALWGIASLLQHPTTTRTGKYRALRAGVLVGLALLTKTSTLLLIPLGALAILWAALTNPSTTPSNWLRRAWSAKGTFILYSLATLLVGGWWYARNLVHYGDPLGITSHVNTPWGRPAPVPLLALTRELPLLLRSFWAAYGWGHVFWPNWVYVLLWGLSLVVLARAALGVSKTKAPHQRAIFLLCLLWLVGILAALLHWMRQVFAPHGRLLFPAIGAWAILLTVGLTQTNRQRGLKSLVLAILFTLSTLAPGTRILATFAPPRTMTPDRAAQTVTSGPLIYDARARLLGVKIEPTRVNPGDTVSVRACWEALRPITETYTVFVHLIGPQNQRIAERHTYAGLGRFPTPLWPVGRAFCDTYHLSLKRWAETNIRYQVEIGLFDRETGTRLPSTAPEGFAVEPPVVGAVTVVADTPSATRPMNAHPADALLGKTIALRGYTVPQNITAGETLTVTLHWESVHATEDSLVAFVHLWPPNAPTPLAQDDTPPRQGWFPTYAWQPGDWVSDTHTLDLPPNLTPGDYPLWAGLYRASDGTRLLAVGPDGRYPYDLVPLGILRIEERIEN